jgi:hypothetical protein
MNPGSKSLIGTWRLKSWESRSEDGRVTYPLGPDAVGYLSYTADGFMAGTMMCRDRPPFAGPDLRGGSPVEKAAAVDTYLTYCGRYEVREGMAIHHIELSLFPNWIGADHERFFELEGDQLTITTPPLQIGGQSVQRLVWERAR